MRQHQPNPRSCASPGAIPSGHDPKGALQRAADASAPSRRLSALQNTANAAPVAQLESYIKNKTDIMHLHLDIGMGDHLQIGGTRHDLMGRGGYSLDRLQRAHEAMHARRGVEGMSGYAEIEAWLTAQIDALSPDEERDADPQSDQEDEPDWASMTPQEINAYYQSRK